MADVKKAVDFETPEQFGQMRKDVLAMQNEKFHQGLEEIGLSVEVMKKMIQRDAQGALTTFLRQVAKAPDKMGAPPALNALVGSLMAPIDSLANFAERFPRVTQVAVGAASAVMGLKAATIARGYA